MDVIETAIRKALEKGDATDRVFREKVYRSAFAALERALKANPGATVETAINRRKSLQAKIADIETEFMPAAPAAEPRQSAPAVEPERATQSIDPDDPGGPHKVERADPAIEPESTAPVVNFDNGAPSVAGDEPPAPEPDIAAAERALAEISLQDEAAPGPAPSVSAPASGPEPKPEAESGATSRAPEPTVDPEGAYSSQASEALVLPGDHRREPRIDPGDRSETFAADDAISRQYDGATEGQRRRRPFATMFLILTLLAAVGIGVWWGVDTGLFKTPSELDTSVRNPPRMAVEEDYSPEEGQTAAPVKPGQSGPERNWITVFSPADPASVDAPADASAEIMEDDSGSFIRIRSGAAGSEIKFDVGQGVLEQLAGKRGVFDIVARAEEGKETQMSVVCDFGALGDCVRKRYEVGYEQGDFLFEIDFANKRPDAGGTIAINSDIANSGKAIDIYQIRAALAQ